MVKPIADIIHSRNIPQGCIGHQDVVCVSGKSVREASVVVRLLKFVTVVCEPVPPLVELDRHGTLHPHIQVIFHVMCVYVCTARILESVCVCVCVCVRNTDAF
eukprot:GHVR01095802.1.p1 GENE.GHVR01095802.1~~GHVR01095802.1.p1  ORF type:complete len:103 (+),score=35.78 GHVR01095802.1:196-504(+)